MAWARRAFITADVWRAAVRQGVTLPWSLPPMTYSQVFEDAPIPKLREDAEL